MLVASTRMYNVAPTATAAWHRLLGHTFQLAGLSLRIDDHPHPASLASLWDRPDLGCAFMCGWPLAQEAGSRPIIAAPIPLGSAEPRYRSVFVVKADAPFQTLEHTFGHRFAFNARSSHSGWNMPQAHLARLGGKFAAELGPFGPHQNAAASVLAGEADVAAIDSLVWALLCRHAQAMAAGLRVIGQTPDQPAHPWSVRPHCDPAMLNACAPPSQGCRGQPPARRCWPMSAWPASPRHRWPTTTKR